MRTVVRYLPLLTISACQPSQQELTDQTFESLIRAERTFAETSRASGTRDAFLEFLAPDAVVFDAGPVNGRSVWQERSAGPAILFWTPEIADVSAAGDMGYTSGPWEVRATLGAEPSGWGHFVSVWRRNPEGTWRVVADGGVVHGPATLRPDNVVERAKWDWETGAELEKHDMKEAIAALRRYDLLYSRSVAEKGLAESLDDFVDASARFYRNGHLPLVGREIIATTAAVVDAVWSNWEVHGTIMSNSGDLGCTYGVVQTRGEAEGASPQARASYYRIWKVDGESTWRVVIDVLIPFQL